MRYGFPMIVWKAGDWLFRRIQNIVGRIRFLILCTLWRVEYAGCGIFVGRIVMLTKKKGDIKLGKNVRIHSSRRASPSGIERPSLLDTWSGGTIEIGDNCGMSFVAISSRKKIVIGNNVMIGANAKIFDHNFHSLDYMARRKPGAGDEFPKEVSIGNDVFIGSDAVILKGSRIGDGCTIGANSVVCGLDIPAGSVVCGNPAAVVVKKRTLKKLPVAAS